jgi:predicted metalloprotease with PDZ domain
MEGMYAFWIFNLLETDPQGATAVVLSHEFLHSWIGVRVGEYDACWWKEGASFYAGYLIAKRNNISTQDLFKKEIVTVDLTGTDVYALSDPAVRPAIFTNKKIGAHVYRKGAQICMLMDQRIRDATHDKADIIDMLAVFVKKYDGQSFYLHEYVTFIKQYSGADVDDIVANYVTQKGLIPDSILLKNYRALGNRGALGTFIPETTGTNQPKEASIFEKSGKL